MLRNTATQAAVCLAAALLAQGAVGQDPKKEVVITNKTAAAITYQYRAILNDGTGSDRRYRSVTHDKAATIGLTAAGVPDYGIVVRLRADGTRQGRKLYAKLGPYEIRSSLDPLLGTRVYDLYDAQGAKVEVVAISD